MSSEVKICSFEPCGRRHAALGYCHAHYQQLTRSKKGLQPIRKPLPKDCVFSGCPSRPAARGYCKGHHAQLQRGEELTPLNFIVPAVCVFPDCGAVQPNRSAFALCKRHKYLRQYSLDERAIRDLFNSPACGICGSSKSADGTALHVDHDHSCCPQKEKSCGSCVRGLLCFRCNQTIGQFEDNADLLRAAITYLEAS